MAQLELYSMAVCPFAQRARIMLALKGVEFSLTEIDITRPRPAWFLEINPLGQVPVIRHEGKLLNESSVICEYLEDAFPEPKVASRDPYRKALGRILADHCNQKFVPAMYRLLLNQDRAQDAKLTEEALSSWRWVNDFLDKHNPGGTYLHDGDGFALAEVNFAPFFMRYCLNEYYRGFRLPDEPAYARVRRFRDALLENEAVRQTGMSDEDFIKLYYDYARGYGNGAVPPGSTHSSFDMSIPLSQRPMPPRS